jgi:hypothetical protein
MHRTAAAVTRSFGRESPWRFTMCRAFAVGLLGALLAAPVVAAPIAKERTDGPVTPEQLAKSADNLKRIATAMHEYHDAHDLRLPVNRLSKDKKPLLSWRVLILPYLGEKKLYEQFRLDEPWDSAHNKTLIERVPAVYAPVRGTASKGQTFYQVFRPGERPNLPSYCPDGTNWTFMVAEAAKPVTWTEPADLEFDGETVPALGGLFDGRFHAAFADGEVKRFRKDAPAAALKLLICPDDGLIVPDEYGLDEEPKRRK